MVLKQFLKFLRKFFVTSIAVCALGGGSVAQKTFNYSIAGSIPGSSKILLSADMFGGEILDSASNPGGKFSFKASAKQVTLGTLIVEKEGKRFPDYHSFFIEPGNLKVSQLPGGQVLVRGSKNNDIAAAVESSNPDFWTKVPPMYDSLNFASMNLSRLHSTDEVNRDSIAYYQSITKRMEEASLPYIIKRSKTLMEAFRKYPNTFYTAYFAMNSFELPNDTLENLYMKFDDDLKESSIGKEWHKKLYETTVLQPGDAAVAFTATAVEGKTISLSDYKGKYVLLDFWATWCVPCRAGNPHLIELYKKYKEKGIEFIGVADDDQNVEGWKKAILNDGIGLWPQVLRGREAKDENGESRDISNKYTVHSYPTKILIDPNGMIIGRYGEGGEGDEALDEKLAAIFQ